MFVTHVYHTVYISHCPIFGTIVFSHDVTTLVSKSMQFLSRQVVVVTDVFVQVPWAVNSLGRPIVNDIAAQSLHDVDILVDFICFNMSNRLIE